MPDRCSTVRILYTLVKPLDVIDVFPNWDLLSIIDALIVIHDSFKSTLWLVALAGLLLMLLTSVGYIIWFLPGDYLPFLFPIYRINKESTLKINLYAMIMSLVIVIQLVATILAFVKLEEYRIQVGGISIGCLILEAIAISGACFIKQ